VTVTLSAPVKAGMLAGITDEGLIPLIVIDHADWAAPIRLSGDRVDTVSRGETYTATPFELSLPDDIDGRPRSAQLALVDLSRGLTAALRTARGAPTVAIELVRLADPDSLEASFSGLRIQEPAWASPEPTITMRLVGGASGEERFPQARFVPSRWPGLF
jgi:hypothetical protein